MIKTLEMTIINTKKVNTKRWKALFHIIIQDRLIRLAQKLPNYPEMLLLRNNTACRLLHPKTVNKNCKKETSHLCKTQQRCNALKVHNNFLIAQTVKPQEQPFLRKQAQVINKIIQTLTRKPVTNTIIKSNKINTMPQSKASATYSRHKAKLRSTRCFKKSGLRVTLRKV